VNVYATIDELKTFLAGGLEEGISEDDDDLFKRFCIVASRAFDTWVTNGVSPKRRFYPTIATKDFDHPSSDTTLLKVNNDLLEVTTLTTENGAVAISSSDYVLKAATGDYNRTPYTQVQLVEDGTTTTYSYNGSVYKANALTGVWGYHDEWADAWEDSGDTVQDDPLSDSATTLTVNDADGDDINGLPRRFKIQYLLKIESEYLWVTDVNTSANTLTVRRGMNGSTAASHVQGTAISIFRPMDEIRHAIETLAAYLYQRRHSIGTVDDRPLATMEGVLVMPSMLPEVVQKILRPYRKERL
jgi:hypothetical protein